MKKIIKAQAGISTGLLTSSYNWQQPMVLKKPVIPYSYHQATNTPLPNLAQQFSNNTSQYKGSSNTENSQEVSARQGNSWGGAVSAIGGAATDFLTNSLFDNSEAGRALATFTSSGLNSTTNTFANNLLNGTPLFQDLGTNTLNGLAGAGVGLVANFAGQGITSALGDTAWGRGIGAGVSSALGTIGGTAASNLIQYGSVAGKSLSDGSKAALIGTKAGASISPIGLGMTVLGTALGSAMGPSKEYGGEYGKGVQIADTAYDAATAAVNFVPGAGQIISGAMALNKGLSNIFGSTDGMTVTDSILGSAWMPFPIKWLNMWGASKTGTFKNQSWQNTERTNSFMGNAFGDLGERFDKARKEAGKTYGTFSQGAKRRAQRNIDFSNSAWGKILAMTDLNELQNIRSQYMSSINNQRYAQDIQGGWTPLYRGKQGMKILSNATNHNIGMRLLSGAALIDNKQMILSNLV